MTLADGHTTLALADLTPCWLKAKYLTGLTLLDDEGKEYPAEFFEHHLMNAVRRIEGMTNISILEEVVTAERHDYHVTDYTKFGFLQLFKTPVRSVTRLAAVYPLASTLVEYPVSWIRLEALHGQIQIVPSSGALGTLIIGRGGDYLPMLSGRLSYLPQLWELDYVAGLDPENLPRDVAEAIAKFTCIEILSIVSDLVRPIGVSSQSVSVDGLSQSQSYTVPAFQQRIMRYLADLYGPDGKQQDLKMTSGLLKQLHDQYTGFNLASV